MRKCMRRWAAPAADEKLAEAGKMPKCVCVKAYITEVYTQWSWSREAGARKKLKK